MPSLSMLLLVLVPFVSLLLLWPADAAEYTVGDGVPNGWETGTNYAIWVQGHTFAVGDVLVFQYVKSQHNVYEVTEGAYRSCDADAGGGAGVLARYGTGYDRVLLTEAKTYWFICQIPGHCIGGMRVAVNVSAGAGRAGRPSTSPSVPLPPNGSAASLAGGSHRSWMVVALGVVVVLFNMLG